MQPQSEVSVSADTEISRTFKLSLQEIQQTFKTISGVTDVLDDKICLVLQKHQNQFFDVYKTHMIEIQKEIRLLELKLEEKQRQLLELQDSGAIARLTKRVKELEKELTLAFDKIVERDKVISTTKLEYQLSAKEVEHLQEKLKGEMRSAVRLRLNGGESKELRDGRYMRSEESSIDLSNNISRQNLFATEIRAKNRKDQSGPKPSSKTQLLKMNIQASVTPSPEPTHLSYQPDIVRDKLTSEVRKLTKTNKELLSNNVKAMSLHSEMEEFFISCVEATKKLVAGRTQQPASRINLSEFSKEDKLNVLSLMLQNNEIVANIYSLIFKKERSPRPSISHAEIISRVESRVESRMESLAESKREARKNVSKKEHRSSEKVERNSSFELKLPTINEAQKGNKVQVIARLLKKRQSVNYNDFL